MVESVGGVILHRMPFTNISSAYFLRQLLETSLLPKDKKARFKDVFSTSAGYLKDHSFK